MVIDIERLRGSEYFLHCVGAGIVYLSLSADGLFAFWKRPFINSGTASKMLFATTFKSKSFLAAPAVNIWIKYLLFGCVRWKVVSAHQIFFLCGWCVCLCAVVTPRELKIEASSHCWPGLLFVHSRKWGLHTKGRQYHLPPHTRTPSRPSAQAQKRCMFTCDVCCLKPCLFSPCLIRLDEISSAPKAERQ